MIVLDIRYLNQFKMKNSVMFSKFYLQKNRIKIILISVFV